MIDHAIYYLETVGLKQDADAVKSQRAMCIELREKLAASDKSLAAWKHAAKGCDDNVQNLYDRIAALEAKLARKDGALQYMSDQSNWLEEDDFVKLKRPGGGRQEGIIMWSHDIRPWAYLRDFIKPAKEG